MWMYNLNEVNRIKERWNPSDNLGIAHPIWEPDLSEDVQYLINVITEQQESIADKIRAIVYQQETIIKLERDKVRHKREIANLHKAVERAKAKCE